MPSQSSSKTALSKSIANFTYRTKEDGSPLRPTLPAHMARWYRHLKKWAPKQHNSFPELIKHGYVTIGKLTYVSSLHMATDYVNHAVCHLMARSIRQLLSATRDRQLLRLHTLQPAAHMLSSRSQLFQPICASRLHKLNPLPVNSETPSQGLAQRNPQLTTMKTIAAKTDSSCLPTSEQRSHENLTAMQTRRSSKP